MNTQKQIFLIVVLFFMFVGGCAAYAVIDLPIRAEDQIAWHEKEEIERGALLYANNCRTCHGNRGEGGIGLPLNTDAFKNQDPLVLARNIDLLTRTLECGRAGTLMPAWLDSNGGALNTRQIEHLVKLITAPATETDPETGQLTNKGWLEAEEFAHNLNHETAVIVGGETLDSIASEHHIGALELARLNDLDPDQQVEKGTHLQLPPTPDKENRTLKVAETASVTKIADRAHVGGIALANLNNIPYKYDEKNQRLTVLNDAGDEAPGLFPGTELQLPDYAVYAVKAGDTLPSIAEKHGLSESAIRDANENFNFPSGAEDELPSQNTLDLPDGVKVVVKTGDTVATIASRHSLEPDDLIAANPAITADTPLGAGQQLDLPNDSVYVVQPGDTIESIAADHPGVTADQLIEDNDIDTSAPFGPEIILNLPQVNAYVVQGQSLDELAKTFSNVTAAELAEANGIPENAILRVGQNLRLPDSAWGSFPPDAINTGTACVQYTVPTSVYEDISGTSTETPVERPTEVSTEVIVNANANDWTIIADGVEQEPNKGAVLIDAGTVVKFVDVVGLHTITINGEKDDGDINTGDERDITFSTAGDFNITCDYHPAMLADIFVQ